jgi:hypothetical protein
MLYFTLHPSVKWIALGFVLQFLSGFILHAAGAAGGGYAFGMVVLIVGEGIGLYGCSAFMEEKGWPEWLGWLGLLNVLGLLILFCLPDRT